MIYVFILGTYYDFLEMKKFVEKYSKIYIYRSYYIFSTLQHFIGSHAFE